MRPKTNSSAAGEIIGINDDINDNEEREEGKDDKVDDGHADLEGGERPMLILTTVAEATRNLRAAEDALCARFVKDVGDAIDADGPAATLDQAYARLHASHEVLSHAYLNDYLSRAAMQLFIASAAKARKSQREIALRSLMSDLERSLGFTIQPSSDPGVHGPRWARRRPRHGGALRARRGRAWATPFLGKQSRPAHRGRRNFS